MNGINYKFIFAGDQHGKVGVKIDKEINIIIEFAWRFLGETGYKRRIN